MITVSFHVFSAAAGMRTGPIHDEYSALSQPSYGLLLELQSRSITHTSGEPYYNLPKHSSPRTILSNSYATSSNCKDFVILQLSNEEANNFLSEYAIFALFLHLVWH